MYLFLLELIRRVTCSWRTRGITKSSTNKGDHSCQCAWRGGNHSFSLNINVLHERQAPEAPRELRELEDLEVRVGGTSLPPARQAFPITLIRNNPPLDRQIPRFHVRN